MHAHARAEGQGVAEGEVKLGERGAFSCQLKLSLQGDGKEPGEGSRR